MKSLETLKSSQKIVLLTTEEQKSVIGGQSDGWGMSVHIPPTQCPATGNVLEQVVVDFSRKSDELQVDSAMILTFMSDDKEG